MTFLRKTLSLAALLCAAGVVRAQTPQLMPGADVNTDPRWHAFLGCWQTSAPGYKGPTVCLLPSDTASRVELIALSGDSVLSRSTVTADGVKHPVTRDGCTGWESATWSQDDRRLFTRGEFRCGSGQPQIATGIYSMNHGDAFARVEGVKTRGSSRARVVTFEWMDTVRLPRDIAMRFPNLAGMRVMGARIEASSPVSTADVVEATKTVEPDVVTAWLGNRGQNFHVNARDLRGLRDSKVSDDVIDMMVALSNPRIFVVQPGMAPETRVAQANTRGGSSIDQLALEREMRVRSALAYGWGDMWFPYNNAWTYGDPFFSPLYGSYFSRWSPYFNPYFYNGAYYNGYYNGLYGSGFGTGYYPGNTIIGNGPYVIAPVNPTRTEQPGRVINGAGYSASNGSSGGGARPTPSVSSGGYSSGSGGSSGPVQAQSGGGYSGGSSSSGASGGGEQRTAKPRP